MPWLHCKFEMYSYRKQQLVCSYV